MAIFKGFKQVFQSEYDATPNEEKKGYMWLVRENTEAEDGKIYFGTRLYTPLSTGNGNAIDAYTKKEVDELLKNKIGIEEFSAMSALVADIMSLIGLTVGEEEISLTLSEVFNGATTVVAALELLADKLSDVENAVVAAQTSATQALADAAAAQATADDAKDAAAAAQATADDAKGKIDAFLSDNDLTEGVVDTLKEIQDYITSDGEAADKLTQGITAAQATANDAKDAVAALKQEVIDNEEVVSTALNDLKDKVDTVEIGAQVNVIEKVKLFGNELEVAEDKSVDVEFSAKDVKLGTTVDAYGANAKVTDVLEGIFNVLEAINKENGGVLEVAAGDDSVIVSGESVAKTIAVQISSAEGNRLVLNTTEGEKGLYVEPLYYDGNDAEV
jgi:hypothetical protein